MCEILESCLQRTHHLTVFENYIDAGYCTVVLFMAESFTSEGSYENSCHPFNLANSASFLSYDYLEKPYYIQLSLIERCTQENVFFFFVIFLHSKLIF